MVIERHRSDVGELAKLCILSNASSHIEIVLRADIAHIYRAGVIASPVDELRDRVAKLCRL